MSKLISKLEETIIVIVLSAMSLIAFSNIISRNLVKFSLSFTEEITVNLFVFLTFVGAAIGVRKNAHLGFSLLLEKSPLKIQRTLVILIGAISTFVFILITYYAINMILFQLNMGTTSPALRWPKWIFSLGIPIGTALCVYRTIESTIRQYKNLSTERKGN